MRGARDQEKRHHQNAVIEARWIGVFSQAHIRAHEGLLKTALSEKKPPRIMSGIEIGSAMKAWAKATARG